MAVSRVKTSSILQGFPKSRSLLAGNTAYSPSSYESIQTVTIGSGGAAYADFTSIPSTYKHLQIRSMSSSSYGGNTPVFIRINSDSASNYSVHGLSGNGSAAAAFASAPDVWMNIYRQASPTELTNAQGVGVTDILDYTNINKNKTIRSIGGFDSNGAGVFWLFSGAWLNTSAITSIRVLPNVGNFNQYSTFALYGIK